MGEKAERRGNGTRQREVVEKRRSDEGQRREE